MSNTTDRYCWPSTCALDILINAAPRDAVIRAASLLEGGNAPAYLLRGLSYITHLLTNHSADSDHPQGHTNAIKAVSELVELVSRLIEMDTAADGYRACKALNEYQAYMTASEISNEKVTA